MQFFLEAQPSRPGSKAKGAPVIGFLCNAAEFDNIADCSLWLANDRSYNDRRYVFRSDDDGHALMNIDSGDMPLKLLKSVGSDRSKKGDHSTYDYRGSNVEVRVEYVITSVCAPDDDKCEALAFNARITVTTRSGKQVVQADGICGS